MAEWRAGLRNYHIKPAFSQTLRESLPHILGLRKKTKKAQNHEDQGAHAISVNYC